jgi:hypothetical protein
MGDGVDVRCSMFDVCFSVYGSDLKLLDNDTLRSTRYRCYFGTERDSLFIYKVYTSMKTFLHIHQHIGLERLSLTTVLSTLIKKPQYVSTASSVVMEWSHR